MHFAAKSGCADIGRALLRCGRAPTPLHLAAIGGHTVAVQGLVAAGADIAVVDAKGLTALHHAVLAGHYDGVKILLGAGADPNAAARRCTPLHIAAACDNAPIVRALLEAGASPKAKDEDGNTPA